MKKKTIIPAKYVLIIVFASMIMFPFLLYVVPLVVFYIFTFGNSIVPYQVVFVGISFGAFLGFHFIFLPGYNKLIIKNGTICNYIVDNTNNDGWCEDISNIKKVKLVGKQEVQKYYSQFNKSKAILIDFGNYNIKYIYAGMFSKRQIRKIINLLEGQMQS